MAARTVIVIVILTEILLVSVQGVEICGEFCLCSCGADACQLLQCSPPSTATTLDLSNQRISQISAEAFQYPDSGESLLALDLSDNQLIYMREVTFQPLSSLRNLTMRRAFIAPWAIPDSYFAANQELQLLDLSDNDQLLTWEPKALAGLNELIALNASDSSIPNSSLFLQDTTSLRSCDLSRCNLRDIPTDYLQSLSLLEVLDLSGNKLTGIESNNLPDSPLKLLNVKDNFIRSMSEDVPENLPPDCVIRLGGNPLNCNCTLAWMSETDFAANTQGAVCASPPEFAGMSVQDVDITPCVTPSSSSTPSQTSIRTTPRRTTYSTTATATRQSSSSSIPTTTTVSSSSPSTDVPMSTASTPGSTSSTPGSTTSTPGSTTSTPGSTTSTDGLTTSPIVTTSASGTSTPLYTTTSSSTTILPDNQFSSTIAIVATISLIVAATSLVATVIYFWR